MPKYEEPKKTEEVVVENPPASAPVKEENVPVTNPPASDPVVVHDGVISRMPR